MRNFLRSATFVLSSILVGYSAFSIMFVEYLVFSDRVLGYYWSDSIHPPQLYLDSDDGRKIALYAYKDDVSYWSGTMTEFSNRFLFPLDPRGSYEEYFFRYSPSKKPITEKPLLLSVRRFKKFENAEAFVSNFSETLSDLTSKFGNHKQFMDHGDVCYFWRKWNESLVLISDRRNHMIFMILSDTRIMDDHGDVLTSIPKKRSPLLLISRLGFFKKVWYSSE